MPGCKVVRKITDASGIDHFENGALCQEIIDRNLTAFSDIWFNPEKSLNCQAEACAIFSGIMNAGETVPADFGEFVRLIWGYYPRFD